MTLLETWRNQAYSEEISEKESTAFWQNYFLIEKGIYEKILAEPEVVVEGTVRELAERFGCELNIMVGVLDGINDSLKNPNPIEEMDENTRVNLGYDKEKLYYNMVEAKAQWLYELPMCKVKAVLILPVSHGDGEGEHLDSQLLPQPGGDIGGGVGGEFDARHSWPPLSYRAEPEVHP